MTFMNNIAVRIILLILLSILLFFTGPNSDGLHPKAADSEHLITSMYGLLPGTTPINLRLNKDLVSHTITLYSLSCLKLVVIL